MFLEHRFKALLNAFNPFDCQRIERIGASQIFVPAELFIEKAVLFLAKIETTEAVAAALAIVKEGTLLARHTFAAVVHVIAVDEVPRVGAPFATIQVNAIDAAF